MHQQHTIEELDCTPSAVGVYVYIEKENQYYIEHKHELFKMEFDNLLRQHNIAQILIH